MKTVGLLNLWELEDLASASAVIRGCQRLRKNNLLWINQVYYWRYRSKTHKHNIFFTWLIKTGSIYKSDENAKLEGLGLETKGSN